MELLGPAGLGIHDRHVVEECAAELLKLFRAGSHSEQGFLEYQFNLQLGVIHGVECLQAMVGQLAAHGGEEIMTLLQSFDKIGVGVNILVSGLAEPLDVGFVSLRVLDSHGLVGPPGRDDLGPERMLGDHLVPAQIVGGIVCRADNLDSELTDERLAAELLGGELGVAFLEYLPGRGRAEELVDSKNPAELEVGPVVERVPHGVGNSLRPFLECLPGGFGSSCEIFFRHAVSPHRAPLVMVTVVAIHKPELGDVLELDVLGYLPWDKVAMVVDDWHFRRMLMIQHVRSIIAEHESVINESHYSLSC